MILLLILGAIVNIAVAWGAAFTWHEFPPASQWSETKGVAWSRVIPPRWPEFADHLASSGRSRSIDRFHTQRDDIHDNAVFCIDVYSLGWPCHSVQSESWFEFTISNDLNSSTDFREDGHPEPSVWRCGVPINRGMSRALPIRPIWPGFAINTVFYAAVLWGLFAVPFALRQRRRIKRGLCPKCAYPIGTSDNCTECGTGLIG